MAEWSTTETCWGRQQVLVLKATLKNTARDMREAQARAVSFLGKLALITLANKNV